MAPCLTSASIDEDTTREIQLLETDC